MKLTSGIIVVTGLLLLVMPVAVLSQQEKKRVASMRRAFLLIGIAIVSVGLSFGQKGSAEPGFYPRGYYGDTWTGLVTSANEDTREFTLTYKKKDKEETFTGVLPKEYTHKTADGKDVQIKLSDLMGMTIRAYYSSNTKKVNDQKIKYNDVLKIKILALAKP